MTTSRLLRRPYDVIVLQLQRQVGTANDKLVPDGAWLPSTVTEDVAAETTAISRSGLPAPRRVLRCRPSSFRRPSLNSDAVDDAAQRGTAHARVMRARWENYTGRRKKRPVISHYESETVHRGPQKRATSFSL